MTSRCMTTVQASYGQHQLTSESLSPGRNEPFLGAYLKDRKPHCRGDRRTGKQGRHDCSGFGKIFG